MICESSHTRISCRLLTRARGSAPQPRYIATDDLGLTELTMSASQYYALATCTILFYDHFLTLADEVGRLSTLCIPSRLRLITYPVKGQIRLVRKEIVEYATPQNEPMIPADYRIAFWLFLVVRPVYTSALSALLTEACRIGIFRWGFSFGC